MLCKPAAVEYLWTRNCRKTVIETSEVVFCECDLALILKLWNYILPMI